MKNYLRKVMGEDKKSLDAVFLRFIFWPLSFVYGLGVLLTRYLYQAGFLKISRLPAKVVSVGNITWGGTGKTPLVEYIVNFYLKEKKSPAVLMRGYQTIDGFSNDEALMLRESFKVPILVGANRNEKALNHLKSHSTDVFVLDDGFQHWKIFRDLDILVINAADPFGNECLIPRGILREPLTSMKRADVIVLTKTNYATTDSEKIKEQIRFFNAEALVVEAVHQPDILLDIRNSSRQLNVSYLKGKSICAFCSIGDPTSFYNTLNHLGANVQKFFPFADHHLYKPSDSKGIIDYCATHQIREVIVTEKDRVKLAPFVENFSDVNLLSLKIRIAIVKGRDEFHRQLSSLFQR